MNASCYGANQCSACNWSIRMLAAGVLITLAHTTHTHARTRTCAHTHTHTKHRLVHVFIHKHHVRENYQYTYVGSTVVLLGYVQQSLSHHFTNFLVFVN